MSAEFSGSWGLVTGAGSGIGRATAAELASLGANLVLADIAPSGAEDLAHEISARGGKVETIRLDVGDFEKVQSEIGRASRSAGGFRYVVNAAGISGSAPIEALTPDEIERVFRVNVFGTMYVCSTVLPDMMAAQRGSIVNISSLHAQNGQANAANYAASKGAIIGLTKSIAREKAPYGIRANAVAPGPIDTPLWRAAQRGPDVEAAIARRIRSIPLGRLGTPQDVAGAIVFLLGPASAYITGQVIPVGGGEIMR
jgi:NAD(P)-dependent dehydrogenase (short-subunit alcohol dehydrogenase family)